MGSPLWDRSRGVIALTLGAAALLLGAAAPAPSGSVNVTVSGLRSAKGKVLACLTARPAAFPRCQGDPDARKLAVSASGTVTIDFAAVPAGRYAIALLHDENNNGRPDMMLMIPKEGFGFSRDAAVRMGPPKFDAAAFTVGDAALRQTIRMRYLM